MDNDNPILEEEAKEPAPRTWKEIQLWAATRPKGKFIAIPKKNFGVWYELRKTRTGTVLISLHPDFETNQLEKNIVPWDTIPSFKV